MPRSSRHLRDRISRHLVQKTSWGLNPIVRVRNARQFFHLTKVVDRRRKPSTLSLRWNGAYCLKLLSWVAREVRCCFDFRGTVLRFLSIPRKIMYQQLSIVMVDSTVTDTAGFGKVAWLLSSPEDSASDGFWPAISGPSFAWLDWELHFPGEVFFARDFEFDPGSVGGSLLTVQFNLDRTRPMMVIATVEWIWWNSCCKIW